MSERIMRRNNSYLSNAAVYSVFYIYCRSHKKMFLLRIPGEMTSTLISRRFND